MTRELLSAWMMKIKKNSTLPRLMAIREFLKKSVNMDKKSLEEEMTLLDNLYECIIFVLYL